ncbi:iron ABC transporter permease [Nonomuraea longicatena]|uniref:Iron chelate uptake ABC transporter family permease subunit n=1 Tax=Nonomuraea longicatena TaxID=83682 RepID=A0ABP4AR66_9ACTN
MDLLDIRAAAGSSRRAAVLGAIRRTRRGQIRRLALLAVLCGALLAALLLAAIFIGGVRRLDPADILPAALGLRTGLADYVVFQNRLPRALAAALSGALFGLSGALYQRLIRNPLATPDIVGISAGGGAGATTALILAPSLPFGMPLAALCGSFLLVAAIHAMSWRGGVDTYRLVLVGIGLSAVCVAYTNYLLTAADQHSIAIAMRWLVGSVNGVSWEGVATLAVALILGALGTAALARPLSGMVLGDDMATGLGTAVPRARVATLLLGAGAAALATGVVGPIGFVALISGPIALRLTGGRHTLVLAPLVGALIVLGADLLAQHAPVISPVPTGVLTALLGAPYFFWLILRRRPGATP